ncbi:MAG: biotin--[acetyl-CoA-carboxylase] ligase [Prevotellaceae bacterium]|nr:biotin--[acetyl-CoA-carboxylase] ligase [Prevotellaceae bacterium]
MNRLHVRQTASTMTLLAENPQFALATADYQHSGRGQSGNSWLSRPAENLLLSLRLRPAALSAARRFRLMQYLALAIGETLADFGLRAEIKWPNDIYVDGRKICGFIIENKIAGGRIDESIAGIGLNVNQTEWAAALPCAVSMRQAAGRSFEREAVLRALLRHIALQPELAEADDKWLHADYMKSLYRRTGIHAYLDAGGRFEARIHDVAPDGRLLLARSDGTLRAYGLKEVSFAVK